MKKQEFIEKLKSIAKENGFEIRNESAEEYDLFSVAEKDIWEGVEFAKIINQSPDIPEIRVVKVSEIDVRWVYGYLEGIQVRYKKDELQPITQSAYEEQLKRTVKKKFGEIKEGDRFEEPCGNIDGLYNVIRYNDNDKWEYVKENDQLFHYHIVIYQQGKWATKISTPSVLFRENDSSYSSNPVFTFHVRNFNINYSNGPEIGWHLANEFEKFIQNQQNNEKQQ